MGEKLHSHSDVKLLVPSRRSDIHRERERKRRGYGRKAYLIGVSEAGLDIVFFHPVLEVSNPQCLHFLQGARLMVGIRRRLRLELRLQLATAVDVVGIDLVLCIQAAHLLLLLLSMASDAEYRCFVGGLAWATDDRGLGHAFRSFGEVIESKVPNLPSLFRSVLCSCMFSCSDLYLVRIYF
mgnify:CR=1 FL=1